MADKKSKSQYDIEYAKKKLKRIPLDVTKEKYQEIKIAAENANESVNGYIKKSIEYLYFIFKLFFSWFKNFVGACVPYGSTRQ